MKWQRRREKQKKKQQKMSSTMPFWRMEIWHSFEDFFQTKPFQSHKNNNNNNTPFFSLKSHILFMNIRSRKGKKCHSQTENWCKHKKWFHGSMWYDIFSAWTQLKQKNFEIRKKNRKTFFEPKCRSSRFVFRSE